MGIDDVMRTLRWIGRAAAIVALGLSGVAAGLYLYVQANFNLHAVEAGVVYRSGQLPADRLTRLVKEAGIRSVINLRGEHVGEGWYDQEFHSTRSLGVSLINFPISARSELTLEQMRKISELIRDAEKPVLIHCGGGADRTGLACALYRVDSGQTTDRAREQLSAYYGHFPHLLWEDAAAMDVSLDRYMKLSRVPLTRDAK